MRPWMCLIVWLLLPSAAFAFQNEPTGFREISWGTPLSAVQSQMIPDGTPPGQLYKRVNDKLTIGNATLMDISYEFHNGRFSQVYMLSQEGLINEKAMIAAFLGQFGAATDIHEGGLYVWKGSITNIILNCQHRCNAFIESAAAWEQKQAEEAAERAARLNKDF